MSEERLMILNMLQEGKITQEEALKLLDAIGEKNNYSNDKTKKISDMNFNDMASKIGSAIESAFYKMTDSISNLDTDYRIFNNYTGRILKSIRIDNLEEEINLYIKNRNDKVQVYQWDKDYIEAIANVYYDEREYTRDFDFLIHTINEQNHYIGIDTQKSNKGYSARITVNIPENLVKNLKIETSNSKIEAENLDIDYVEFTTSNGKISLSSVAANSIVCKTSNSKISAKDIEADTLECTTTNGKIVLETLDVRKIDARYTNGSINIDTIKSNAKELSLNSTNGGLYIEGLDYSRPIKATISGRLSHNLSSNFINLNEISRETIATNAKYIEDSEDVLYIFAHTTNGKVEII